MIWLVERNVRFWAALFMSAERQYQPEPPATNDPILVKPLQYYEVQGIVFIRFRRQDGLAQRLKSAKEILSGKTRRLERSLTVVRPASPLPDTFLQKRWLVGISQVHTRYKHMSIQIRLMYYVPSVAPIASDTFQPTMMSSLTSRKSIGIHNNGYPPIILYRELLVAVCLQQRNRFEQTWTWKGLQFPPIPTL